MELMETDWMVITSSCTVQTSCTCLLDASYSRQTSLVHNIIRKHRYAIQVNTRYDQLLRWVMGFSSVLKVQRRPETSDRWLTTWHSLHHWEEHGINLNHTMVPRTDAAVNKINLEPTQPKSWLRVWAPLELRHLRPWGRDLTLYMQEDIICKSCG